MNKYIFSLMLISVGCFTDPGGSSIGDGSDETGTDGGSEVSDDGATTSSGGSSGTASGGNNSSSGGDDGGTTTNESDTSNTSGTSSTSDTSSESNTSGASDTSSASGTQSMCPLGMAFNQDYCWAVAECDPALCVLEGSWECKTNVETCAAYGLEPTAEKIFLEEWNEDVAQDLVDQLGLDGIDETSGGAALSMWNTELNTIGVWGYGSSVEYSNVPVCTQHLYIYWPIHTCFPE